jgi:hypothetical protein
MGGNSRKTKTGKPAEPRRRAAPQGYITIEEWGRQVGKKRTAAYAAVNRGEVPTEPYGMRVIRADWREEAARRAEAEAAEKRRRHAEAIKQRHGSGEAPAAE